MNFTVFLHAGSANELNHRVICLGIGNVGFGNFGNAFGFYLGGVNVFTVGKRCQNTNFTASIVTVYVGRGIPFRIAKFLGQSKSIVKGHTVFNHFGHNKIGGTVQNAQNFGNLVGGQALVHGA